VGGRGRGGQRELFTWRFCASYRVLLCTDGDGRRACGQSCRRRWNSRCHERNSVAQHKLGTHYPRFSVDGLRRTKAELGTMFTGIIEETGSVLAAEEDRDAIKLVIESKVCSKS